MYYLFCKAIPIDNLQIFSKEDFSNKNTGTSFAQVVSQLGQNSTQNSTDFDRTSSSPYKLYISFLSHFLSENIPAQGTLNRLVLDAAIDLHLRGPGAALLNGRNLLE